MKRTNSVASLGAMLLLFSGCGGEENPPSAPLVTGGNTLATTLGPATGGGTTGGAAAGATGVGGAGTGVQGTGAGDAAVTGGAITGSSTGPGATSSASTGSGTVTSAGGAATTTTDAGTTTGAGGTLVGMGGASTDGGANVGDPLQPRLSVSTSTTPEGVHEGDNNWRIWGRGDLNVAPVFSVPLANCGTLVCYTTEGAGGLTPRVAYLDASDALVTTMTLDAGFECRGLAAEPDGNFAALLWDDDADAIFVARYDVTGTLRGAATELVNSGNTPDSFGIGESRLEYGGGTYGAYYHVHSNDGHEGDTLKWVDAASGEESTGWNWGCSHSMSNLLRYHPSLGDFLPACVTDCYPGTGSGDFSQVSIGGIYLNHNDSKVMDVAAGCNGSVAGELGGLAFSPNGYKLVFNAHQAPTTLGQSSYDESSMNQDIGFASIGADLSASAVVWLTDTSDVDEADSSIALWQPAGDATEQYVVGWLAGGSHFLARVDASGAFIEQPVDVSALAGWGRRDDPFRRHVNQDVVWAWFDEAGSTTLNFARLSSGQSATCAAF